MRTTRALAWRAPLVGALVLLACSPPSPAGRGAVTWTPIDPAHRASFVAACAQYDTLALCECVWQRIAERYSQEELRSFLTNNIAPPLLQVDADCRRALVGGSR